MFPCSISGPLKASAATSLHKVTAFQVQKHKCYTLPSPVLCTDTYQSQRTSSQFHQQLKMVRETKGERCIPPPPPYVFPLTVSYTAVSFHYLGHQLASRRLKKNSQFCSTPHLYLSCLLFWKRVLIRKLLPIPGWRIWEASFSDSL